MATARQLITDSLRLLKVNEDGEPISPSQAKDGLRALNQLIDSWANESYMIYQRVQRSVALVSGTGQYTIGSGGDINVTRPLKITSAYSKDTNNFDHQINTSVNNAQWSKIRLKQLETSYPRYLYYRPDFPLGEINLYPQPGSGLTLYLECWDQLSAFTLTDSVLLPPGYERCLKYNLAIEIAPEYKDPSALILKLAAESKEKIKDVNNINIATLVSDVVGIPRNNRRSTFADYYTT